jgi:hypothetical protein
MILDYPHPVDFSNNKSLLRLRRWLATRMAQYISTLEYIKDTNKFFANPENRILGSDYYEAKNNLDTVKHWHWAINEIIKANEEKK